MQPNTNTAIALRLSLQSLVNTTQHNATFIYLLGYNYKNYRSVLPGLQSQGREQVHSQLEKLTSSLRQCSFQSYMILMKTFFFLNNLQKKKFSEF